MDSFYAIIRGAARAALLALLALLLCVPAHAAEPQSYMPGFLSLGTTIEGGGRLDIAVWYPVPATRRGVGTLQIEGWTFRGGRNLKPGAESFPLLVLSHDSAGSRFSHHSIASALAEQGFVVAAPTHPGDNILSTSLMFLPGQVLSRPADILATINTVLEADRFPEGFINTQAIGIIGIGSGAAAALLMAGAVPDDFGMGRHCMEAAPEDPYCSQWAQERLRGMPLAFGAVEARADSRVRAIALLAPAWGMIFPPSSLAGVQVPVYIAAGSEDVHTPPGLHAEPLRDGLPNGAVYRLFKADHAAFFAPYPSVLTEDLPSLGTSLSLKQHRNMTQNIVSDLADFFRTPLELAQ